MQPTGQISGQAFWVKVGGIIAFILFFLLYMFLRSRGRGKRFIISGQMDEEKLLDQGKITLRDLQTSNWSLNAQKTITYAGVSLSSVILASVFVFEQKLQSYDAYMFDIVLSIAGISVMAYFVSLQLWFLALDPGGLVQIRIKYRRKATTFQTIGWFTLILSFVFAATTINTYVGLVFGFLMMCSFIFMYEYKGRVSVEVETEMAHKNAFQDTIDLEKITVKNGTLPLKPITDTDELRILTWNIERGYEPNALADYINHVRPDIVCLQEVDWGNERTNKRDVLQNLAVATQMQGFFGIEFYEIDTPYRTERMAGGGVHGNAFLTTIKPEAVYRIELPIQFDWEHPPKSHAALARREKRLGRRFAMCLEFKRGNRTIIVCSVHLEDKAGGVSGRIRQLTALHETLLERAGDDAILVIGGDMNTLENRLTTLVRIGKRTQRAGKPWTVAEAQWWYTKVLPPLGYQDPFQWDEWTFKKTWLYHEKLDYLLLRNCQAHQRGRGDFNTSDHRPLWAEVMIDA